jgi:2-oxo-4-hydroxy-4-carboxy-5-ureidoimidazoline decarboxylase
LGAQVEHSPWVAEAVAHQRPFASVWALHAAMVECIQRSPRERQLALVNLHPELAGREAADGELTAASNAEQARLGLLSLSRADHERLTALNTAYRQKFGFPMVTAVRLHKDLSTIFIDFERRLTRTDAQELAESLCQIGEVLRGRLARLFGTPMGWVSTHVLDTVTGGPAAGMVYEIAVQDGGGWTTLGQGVTNQYGRTDHPVLVDGALGRHVYQLEFRVGDYFRAGATDPDRLPFLDRVPLRFGIDEPDRHYHVPLLCTPWSYSTYRGS